MAKIYIDVPFSEKEQAKTAALLPDGTSGITWDRNAGAWFFDDRKVDRRRMQSWMDRPVRTESTALAEFKAVLEEAGLVIEGDPVLDGKWQKTRAAGSEKEYKGAYKGNLTAKSANAYFENFFTGEKGGWQYAHQFTPMVLRGSGALFQEDVPRAPGRSSEDAAIALEASKEQIEKDYRAVAEKVAASLAVLPDAGAENPYLRKKGVQPVQGVKRLRDLLVVPMQDAEGHVWSAQYLAPDSKNFRKGGKKTGCFFPIGDVTHGTTVLFCEGFATGASLHQATGLPVIVCFDSGNIHNVATSLAPRMPEKVLLFCGDDDRLTEDVVLARLKKLDLQKSLQMAPFELDALPEQNVPFFTPGGHASWTLVKGENDIDRVVVSLENDAGDKKQLVVLNAGREKSVAAAMEFGGTSVFPAFQVEQRGLTDFNDLHQAEGLDAVKAQIMNAIGLNQSLNALSVWAYRTYGVDVELRETPGKVHTGAFVQHTGVHSAQDIGKKKLVAHLTNRLDKVPEIGAMVKVSDGKLVSHVQIAAKEKGDQR